MKSSKQELSCRGQLMKCEVSQLLREHSWVEDFIISRSNLKLQIASPNCYCCVLDTVTNFAHFVPKAKY